MQVIAESYAELYEILRRKLLRAPLISPRGMSTRELSPVTMCLVNPQSRLGYHPDRKYNLPFAVAEALMLHVPSNDLKFFNWTNPNVSQFSDDGETLYGAYGVRLSGAIEEAVAKIKADPNTRQAIMTISSNIDLIQTTRNYPCTMSIQLLVRDNKLDMHVYMRSNDFVWGLPYDLFMFTCLQEVVANELGINLGSYWHTTTSLHVYERHFVLVEGIRYFVDVECSLPYALNSMKTAAAYYTAMVNGMDPYHPGLMLTMDGPFEQISAYVSCAKREKLYRPDLPPWAYQFMPTLVVMKKEE